MIPLLGQVPGEQIGVGVKRVVEPVATVGVAGETDTELSTDVVEVRVRLAVPVWLEPLRWARTVRVTEPGAALATNVTVGDVRDERVPRELFKDQE